MISDLRIKNLFVNVEDKEILHGINLTVKPGELHVVMGPNGSGKSTLAQTLMGHPNYKIKSQSFDKASAVSPSAVSSGPNCSAEPLRTKVKIGKEIINDLSPDERAKLGLMLAFQNPLAIPGVTISSFLRTAHIELYGKDNFSPLEFHKFLQAQAKNLSLDSAFLRRAINDGFSGGEKKKAEMLQLLVLKPKFAIFDEIDTGLDVDALKTVADGINILQKEGTGVLLITHYQRILHHLKPDRVHVMKAGRIVKSGGPKLAEVIEKKGYANV